ncbi:hypothetical protein II5_05858 [Bacillus cereus MSX-A1]|uniref:insecticidal delta-endotoxin Cry8Ea1 family protein n=1 Tax=Bacillus cereus TaxID=1396 RepID=UPI000279749B|nr:insecticidal delta-endotoxin Cry8Ea1 family protein [Bacillus cereus]EJQ98128.1 hypothetical protein II5_05858 [Bacillus cereus MSX-A1]MDR4293745.1 hypothetical protein [Bacillus cereus]
MVNRNMNNGSKYGADMNNLDYEYFDGPVSNHETENIRGALEGVKPKMITPSKIRPKDEIEESYVPYNVLINSTEVIHNNWKIWGQSTPPVFMPYAIGTIIGLIAKELGKQTFKLLAKKIYSSLFPVESIDIMKAILEATEELVDRKLENLVRQQIEAELIGLQQNLQNFYEDIENFEIQNTINQDEIFRRIQHNPTGEIIQSPRGIIDSINTLNQFFTNRMPQFMLSDWKIELLPLYAQAANLHLLFIRDVLKNAQEWNLTSTEINTYKNRMKEYTKKYSNYCIETYQGGFTERLSSTRFKKILKFRTYMVLNVLDYVGIWSLLRFDKFLLNSSITLFEPLRLGPAINQPDNSPVISETNWKFFNDFLQGRPNKILTGFAAKTLDGFIPSYTEGWSVIPEFRRKSLWGGTRTYYYGGHSSGHYGPAEVPNAWHMSPKWMKGSVNFSLDNPILNPLVKVNGWRSYTKNSYIDQIDDSLQFKTLDGRDILFYNNFSPIEDIYYPDYYIRNVTGVPDIESAERNTNRGVVIGTFSIDIRNGAPDFITENKKFITDVITTFNRTQILDHTENGSIKHVVPYVDDELSPNGKRAIGLVISPLQIHTGYPGGASSDKLTFVERFGNNGDAVGVPNTQNTHSNLTYRIINKENIPVTYRPYVKISVLDNGKSHIGFYINGSGWTQEANAIGPNDGILDNKTLSSYLEFNPITINGGEEVSLSIQLNGSRAHVNSILLIPNDVTPLYEV